MLKLCGFRKEKPLEVIFENCLKEWAFPNECKKTNVVPVHRIVKKKIIIKNKSCERDLNASYGAKYSRMDQVKSFKGCLPQILLGPFLNTLSHM